MGLFLIGLFVVIFINRKEILFQLGGNAPQKNLKAEKKLIEEYLSGNIKKETVAEFVTTSSSLIQSEPTLPRASHTMAKGFYYNLLLSGFAFDTKKLYDFIIEDRNGFAHYSKYEKILNGIYRNALRAEIFQDSFPEQHSNKLLIVLNETLEARINPQIVLQELIKVDYERITPDLRRVYIWLCFIAAINSGDLEELEIVSERNKTMLEEGGMPITEREFLFLKAITAYKKKEYVKALDLFRGVQQEIDFITIESTKYEAMIFHYQNLNDKALSVLDALNQKTNNTDSKIKAKIAFIQNQKANKK
jgi:hypothetical protein